MAFPGAVRTRVLVASLCCAALAWIAGPAGRLLVVLPLLLFGPGYLFERAWAAFEGLSLALRPAIWLGLSISLVVLAYEWATALGLALTAPALYALAAACGFGVVWRFLHEPRTGESPLSVVSAQLQQTTNYGQRTTDNGQATYRASRWVLALLALLALTFWTRSSQIEGLALPPWVDSLHHALMIRISTETGQAPTSLRPYMPVDQLPYHWGYHVFTAAVMQLSGLGLVQTMLWVGQALNALQALVAAALAAYLWRRPLAGVVAALVVGLLSIMPAYYLSWGRYTQLTGLLILPPLMIAWRELLRAPSHGRLACLAVLLGGLSLVHFRILVFALAYLAASGAIWAFATGRAALRARLVYAMAGTALALALAMPWLWMLMLRTLLPAFARPRDLLAGDSYSALSDGLLWAGHNRVLVALALAAALWGVARRRHSAAEQALWVAALALLANPVLIGLPSIWLITNDVVAISLFLPIGVLLGGGACLLIEWLERQATNLIESRAEKREPPVQRDERRALNGTQHFGSRAWRSVRWSLVVGRWSLIRGMAAILLATLALWGAWNIRSVINPGTVLATEADVAAITWAAEHTPADARFLVNAVPWLSIQRGSDGGWWLLPLTGRWVSAPPVLYTYGAPDDVREINEFNKLIIGFRKGQEQQLYALIARERITHVYLGAQTGPLSPEIFADERMFEKVYERDGVTILAVHH
jgi:hypothetical protein